MTLLHAILQKAKSKESLVKKYPSPPPEVDEIVLAAKRKKCVYKYDYVVSRVDSSPPRLKPAAMFRRLPEWRRRLGIIYAGNVQLLIRIKRAHFTRYILGYEDMWYARCLKDMTGIQQNTSIGYTAWHHTELGFHLGCVDSRWRALPPPTLQYFRNRVKFLDQVHQSNKQLFKRIQTTRPRVMTAASLRDDWLRNKREIVSRADRTFVLFPPQSTEALEDDAFLAPKDVRRPRVHLTLRVRDGAVLGELSVELFMDLCPRTCRLFIELLDGDHHGYGYVGTRFFTKVPGLYWSGGDVIYDNGFGCYAQRGRDQPIGAENYHFSHSMPGLLSMRVTRDDEMCGIFNITFKRLSQFDLMNVVFGRIIRPSSTYDIITALGSPLSTRPVVEVIASRRWRNGSWMRGRPNTRLYKW